jgi:hypothetical protein
MLISDTSWQVIVRNRASAVLYHFLLSLPARGKWLLPANICYVVPLTFLKAGYQIYFVDIHPNTLMMNLEQAQELLFSEQFQGLLFWDTYGAPAYPEHVLSTLKQEKPFYLIHDKCSSAFDPITLDTSTDLYLYSTGYAKYAELHYGGIGLVPHHHPLPTSVLPFSLQNLESIEVTFKEAILKQQVWNYQETDWLDTSPLKEEKDIYFARLSHKTAQASAHKQELNAIYSELLPKESCLPASYQQWRFNFFTSEKAVLLQKIFEAGLFASGHFPSLAQVFNQPSCPVASQLAFQVVNLFNDFYFSVKQGLQICGIINDHLERFGDARTPVLHTTL